MRDNMGREGARQSGPCARTSTAGEVAWVVASSPALARVRVWRPVCEHVGRGSGGIRVWHPVRTERRSRSGREHVEGRRGWWWRRGYRMGGGGATREREKERRAVEWIRLARGRREKERKRKLPLVTGEHGHGAPAVCAAPLAHMK